MMQFEIGDIVEHSATPGVQRIVVDIDAGLPYTTPAPNVVLASKDHQRKVREFCVDARFVRLIYRAAAGAGRSAR